MTTRADYTDEEWKNIKARPMLAGLYVSLVASSGPIDTAKEAVVMAQSIADHTQKGSANQLIMTLIDEIKRGRGRSDARDIRLNVKSVQELHTATLDTLRQASAALVKATPEEAAEYKQFITAVAQRVAEAGKEGGFLGIGGTRVSEAETMAIQEINAALGTAA